MEETTEQQGRRVWIAVVGAMLGAFMAILDILITNTAIKEIQGALSATLDEASLISTSYLVAEVIVIPLSGWLTRVLSLRRYFLLSSALFTFFSLLCSLAWNVESMILFRALQGFAGGALVPLGYTTIITTLPLKHRSRGMALFALTATLAPALGPTIGGWLVENFGWKYIFYLNLPAGAVMITLLGLGLRKSTPNWSLLLRGDFIGIVTLILGLGSLEILLEKGRRENWFDSDLIVFLALVAFTGLVLFVIRQLRKQNPLVNLRLLKRRNFSLSSVSNMLMGLGLYGTVFLLPLYLANIQGYNAMQIGIVFMWMGLPQLLFIPLMPKLMELIDPRYLMAAGFFLFSLSCFLCSGLNHSFAGDQLIASQLIRSIGQPLAMVPLNLIAAYGISAADAPSASSLFSIFRKIGGAIGIALLATTLDTQTMRYGAYLKESLNMMNADGYLAETAQTLMAQGTTPIDAENIAVRLAAQLIQREASIMAFNDAFYFIGIGLAVACLLTLLLRHRDQSSSVQVKPTDKHALPQEAT